jgi:lipopolysaccharide export system permease protein
MRLSWTFSRYLGIRFLTGIAIVFGGCACLIFLVDVVELLRRASNRDEVPVQSIIAMALLKLPNVTEAALPFTVLFGGIWAFVRLTRSNELVVARAAGVSAWQFLGPAMAIALALGAFVIVVYNPLAAMLESRYEQLESRYLRGETTTLAMKSTGFWLRQGAGNSQSIIHATKVGGVSQKTMQITDVSVFTYHNQDTFDGLIVAASASLQPGGWRLDNATLWQAKHPPVHYDTYDLPTPLSADQIRESFASPATLSFWELPRFIALARAAGFAALPHRLQWHAILATPLMLCAMVLIAATFSLRLTRLGGVPQLATAGILTGFLFYFLSDVFQALGISGIIPVSLAAWTPAVIALLLGLAMMLHLEDG